MGGGGGGGGGGEVKLASVPNSPARWGPQTDTSIYLVGLLRGLWLSGPRILAGRS